MSKGKKFTDGRGRPTIVVVRRGSSRGVGGKVIEETRKKWRGRPGEKVHLKFKSAVTKIKRDFRSMKEGGVKPMGRECKGSHF